LSVASLKGSRRINKGLAKRLLVRLFKKKDVLVVVGNRRAISELKVRSIQKFQFRSGWFTCECRDWHIHMKYEKIRWVRLVKKVKPTHPSRATYSVVLQGLNHHRLLQAYLRDDEKTFRAISRLLKV
jgi:putative heme degradation protein